jgi:riboflavin kinase/FMN adenylyltransferase
MKIKNTAVAIGTFDGFHLGHRYLVKKLVETAARKELRCVIVALSRPIKPVAGILTTETEKAELMKQYPVDEIVLLPVSQEIIAQSAAVFFEDFLCGKLNMKHLVVGKDFALGRGRQGDTSWLKKECAKKGTGITIVEPKRYRGKTISSSLIREYIKKGDIDSANRLLGRFYHFEGMPEKGRGLGTKMGVPTVNLKVTGGKLLPSGVFTAMIGVGSDIWPAVINIGIRPTFFSEGENVPEANIFGFSGKWPQAATDVYLCSALRKEKRFASMVKLKAQIARDIVKAKRFFRIER